MKNLKRQDQHGSKNTRNEEEEDGAKWTHDTIDGSIKRRKRGFNREFEQARQ